MDQSGTSTDQLDSPTTPFHQLPEAADIAQTDLCLQEIPAQIHKPASNPRSNLVSVVYEGHFVSSTQQSLGQVESNKSMTASFGVHNQAALILDLQSFSACPERGICSLCPFLTFANKAATASVHQSISDSAVSSFCTLPSLRSQIDFK